jgi:hypothetical protein
MITIDMLDKSNIDYDWSTLYVGISMNLIECNELAIYALKIIENNEYKYDEFINELAWGMDYSLKGEILTKMHFKFNIEMLNPQSSSWKLEVKKLRYAILNYLKNTIDYDNELLKKVEEVYADFNYPQEMDGFITYMPNKGNVANNSIEDSVKRMINNLDEFLTIEKKEINDGEYL